MAKIDPNSLRNWNNGETMTEADYEQERTILVTAININADKKIGADDILPDAVTADKIAPASITSEKLVSDSVTNAALADNAVTEANLANGSVTNEKLANGSVTNEKLGTLAFHENSLLLDYPTASLAQRVAQLEQSDLFKSVSGLDLHEYSGTATNGQTVINVGGGGGLAYGRIVAVYVNHVDQRGFFTVTSSTTITLTLPCAAGDALYVQWVTAGADEPAFSSLEVTTARAGFPTLGDRLDAIMGYEVRTKTFTATAGQTVFDISSIGTYAINKGRILVFEVNSVSQFGGFTETSPTVLTLSTPCYAGDSVFIRWHQSGNLSMIAGHAAAHKKDGSDELRISDLAGYDELVFDTGNGARINTLEDRVDVTEADIDGINADLVQQGGHLTSIDARLNGDDTKAGSQNFNMADTGRNVAWWNGLVRVFGFFGQKGSSNSVGGSFSLVDWVHNRNIFKYSQNSNGINGTLTTEFGNTLDDGVGNMKVLGNLTIQGTDQVRMRLNGSVPEYWNGGAWVSLMAGQSQSKIYVASNNVAVTLASTEVVSPALAAGGTVYFQVGSWIPSFDGFVNFSFDIASSSNDGNSSMYLFAVGDHAGSYVDTGYSSVFPIGVGPSGSVFPYLLSTPPGTTVPTVTYSTSISAQLMSLTTVTTTTYTTKTAPFATAVFAGRPVFFIAIGQRNVAPGTVKIKNIKIKYDLTTLSGT